MSRIQSGQFLLWKTALVKKCKNLKLTIFCYIWLFCGAVWLQFYISSGNPGLEAAKLAQKRLQALRDTKEFTVFTRFVARALIFFNQTHYRALIQTGPYSSTGACYFQSKIMHKNYR